MLDDQEVTDHLYSNSDQLIGYWDTAKAIVFHHAEVMSLDPATAAHTMASHIEASPHLRDFAYILCCQGPAYEHEDGVLDGWAVLVPQQQQDETGTTVYLKRGADGKAVWSAGQDGDLIYDYQFSAITQAKMVDTIKDVLRSTKDDAQLQNKSWQRFGGITSATQGQEPDPADQRLPADIYVQKSDGGSADGGSADGGSSDAGAADNAADGDGGYALSLSRPKGSWHDGILVTGFVTDPESRQCSVWVMNWFQRYLSVYFQFEDADGNAVAPDKGSWASQLEQEILENISLETETLKFNTFVGGPPLLGALPVLPPIPTEIKLPA